MKIFTLNCGNGALGEETANAIVKDFHQTTADLFILNCQEADFEKIEQELRNAINPKQVKISSLAKLVTHTKYYTQFHDKTGMVTLILHKPELTIGPVTVKEARREKGRLCSGNNKGGMLTRLPVTKEKETYLIENINGHLDSFNSTLRTADWNNLYALQQHKVKSWPELCNALPDFFCSGYDANTRNKILPHQKESISVWTKPIAPEVQAIVMAPLGNYRESSTSTYRSNQKDIINTPDKKRKLYALGGTLDIVAYSNRFTILNNQQMSIIDTNAGRIDPLEDELRDHAVISSQLLHITPHSSAFEKVRNHIACSLVEAAPELAKHILRPNFTDTSGNQLFLLNIYQQYLSPEGLMSKYLHLHQQKLRFLAAFNPQEESERLTYQAQLFANRPWFSLEGHPLPNNVSTLNQTINYHHLCFNLEHLKSHFLALADTQAERNKIEAIIQNSLNCLSANVSQREYSLWLQNTRQLLSFNHMVHNYDAHLKNATYWQPHDELLQSKQSLVNSFKQNLEQNKEPKQIIKALNIQINKAKEMLEKHRHNNFFIKFLRALWEIITEEPVLSQGEIFFNKAKETIAPSNKKNPTIKNTAI